VSEFMLEVTRNTLEKEIEDEWKWKDSEINSYSIKSIYTKLENNS